MTLLIFTVDYVFLSIFCFPIFFYLVSRHQVRMSAIFASLVSPTTIDLLVLPLQGISKAFTRLTSASDRLVIERSRYINDLINPYKTIVYTSTLALMLDDEGQDLLNFILSQHTLPSEQRLCCLDVSKSYNMIHVSTSQVLQLHPQNQCLSDVTLFQHMIIYSFVVPV